MFNKGDKVVVNKNIREYERHLPLKMTEGKVIEVIGFEEGRLAMSEDKYYFGELIHCSDKKYYKPSWLSKYISKKNNISMY